MKIFVTGGAGFIGSAVIRFLIKETTHEVLNFDALTYAGNLDSLKEVSQNERYQFVHANLSNKKDIQDAFLSFQPDAVMHLAAESHVDRSIDGPGEFIQTNIIGTYNILEVAREYLENYHSPNDFRFHHISTDEVFGSLGTEGFFTEESQYQPSSPYSASKASSDHLVRAWHHTFGLPVLITNCSNNYGPYHFPEKLIPLMILKGLKEEPLPVYGKGDNVRDWLFVEDHARALVRVVEKGTPGETYNIGGKSEKTNLEVVEAICDALDELVPSKALENRRSLISFVEDRPGHDQRYAIDPQKIERELDFSPSLSFEEGLRSTIDWYLNNRWWWEPILSGEYNQNDRLGLKVNQKTTENREHV